MNNYNTDFTFMQVNSKFIFSDMSYQRAVDENRVKRIVANFDENLVNPIKVSYRDGRYYVFDGQHTLAALKLRNHNRDLMVYCKVYKNLTKEKEAILFSQQNGISRAVTSNAKFKALYAANDVEITEMVNLANMAGLKVDFSCSKANNKIIAVAKLYKMFKGTSASEFVQILHTIKSAWNGDSESLCTEIIGGMYIFCTTYRGKFDYKILEKQLSKAPYIQIVSTGKMYKDGGDTRFAIQILSAYNKNLSRNRLKDEFKR